MGGITGPGVTGGGGAPSNEDYVTYSDESAQLPNSRQLVAGTNITLDTTTPGEIAVNATGGGGADPDLTYLTVDDETADLPNSRQLVAGTNITFDTATPGELAISAAAETSGTFTVTWATGYTTQPTQDWAYTKIGNVVVVRMTTAASGTSNATTLSTSVGDVPALIRPPSGSRTLGGTTGAQDNGTAVQALITISNSGTMTANVNVNGAPNAWTASGNKGFTTITNRVTSFVYLL